MIDGNDERATSASIQLHLLSRLQSASAGAIPHIARTKTTDAVADSLAHELLPLVGGHSSIAAVSATTDAKKLIDRAWASPVADNTMRALVRATIPVRVLKGTASVIFFLRRLWKILRLTTSIRPPNHRVNYCSALPALLQLGGPWHALLGSDGRDASERPILDAFKAFGLDHRNLSDWRALVFHLARVLFPTPRPPGAPRKWPGERLCQLLADVAAAKRKHPNASDTVICTWLEKRYRPLSAAWLRRILQDARNPARNQVLATALALVGPQILDAERAMHESWSEADEKNSDPR